MSVAERVLNPHDIVGLVGAVLVYRDNLFFVQLKSLVLVLAEADAALVVIEV